MLRGRSIVNITEDVRKYAADQAISGQEALAKRSGVDSRRSSWRKARRFTRRREEQPPFLAPAPC